MTTFRSLLAITAVAVALTFQGCAHSGVRADDVTAGASGNSGAPSLTGAGVGGSAEVMGPAAPFGPLPVPGYVPPNEGYVLVLGPGLARALAYIGVLHEMESRGLPIHAVVGVEMGAVVAGIWASSNSNNLEWQMHKFKRETLLDLPVFGLGDRVAEGRKLYEFLDDALKVNLLQQMKVQAVIASALPNTDTVLTESNGSAKDIIRGAMGIPGLIKAYSWDAKERESASMVQPFPAATAKSLAVGKVVCFDVIGRGDNFKPKEAIESQIATLMKSVSALAKQELKDCDVTVSIPLDDVSYLDFDAKADLISRGRESVRKWLESEK